MAPFDLKEEILRLKEERNAIILAHSYQTGDIQDMADYVGDSLGLAYKAQNTDCDVIAFCGVHFMAETAKILNPDKTVILPDADAGCSLEASCDAGELEAFLKENAHKNYYVVAYVNCSIGVKALADVIVTSGNAVKIVSQAPEDRPILFVPDQNLGAWVSRSLAAPGTVERGLPRAHGVHAGPDSCPEGKAPRRAGGGPSGMHGGRAPAGGPYLLHGKNDPLLHGKPRQIFHHCDGIRHSCTVSASWCRAKNSFPRPRSNAPAAPART